MGQRVAGHFISVAEQAPQQCAVGAAGQSKEGGAGGAAVGAAPAPQDGPEGGFRFCGDSVVVLRRNGRQGGWGGWGWQDQSGPCQGPDSRRPVRSSEPGYMLSTGLQGQGDQPLLWSNPCSALPTCTALSHREKDELWGGTWRQSAGRRQRGAHAAVGVGGGAAAAIPAGKTCSSSESTRNTHRFLQACCAAVAGWAATFRCRCRWSMSPPPQLAPARPAVHLRR